MSATPSQSTDKQRILILSASAGSGHLHAAEALRELFAKDPRVEQVLHEDVLIHTNPFFRYFYSGFYKRLILSFPTFLGWFYKLTDRPWKIDKLRTFLDRINLYRTRRLILDFKPDKIICTHFLPSQLVSYLISQRKISSHLSIIVTDYEFHAIWLSQSFHRYFVASENAQLRLEKLGITQSSITLSGIPITSNFSSLKDPNEIKKTLLLDPHLPLILLSSGTEGIASVDEILTQLQTLKTPAQVAVVCGKNRSQLDKVFLKKINWDKELSLKLIPLGYVENMDQWMRASDVFISKPGGLISSEAMAIGLPMIIVSPIPGQEDCNSDYLLEKGAAIKSQNFSSIPAKIDSLLRDPFKLALMRNRCHRVAYPHATETIVNLLLSSEEKSTPLVRITRTQQQAMKDL